MLCHFQSLETELASHKVVLMGVVNRGHELVTAGHTSSETITKKGKELLEAWSNLSKAVDTRTKTLNDSLAAQQVCMCVCVSVILHLPIFRYSG